MKKVSNFVKDIQKCVYLFKPKDREEGRIRTKYYIMYNRKLSNIRGILKEELNGMKFYLKKQAVSQQDTITIGWFIDLHLKINIDHT